MDSRCRASDRDYLGREGRDAVITYLDNTLALAVSEGMTIQLDSMKAFEENFGAQQQEHLDDDIVGATGEEISAGESSHGRPTAKRPRLEL